MTIKTVLSLFDYSGIWSEPWNNDERFNVIRIDIQTNPAHDILKMDPSEFSDVAVILAAPPCTHFTNASSRFWKTYDSDGRTAYSKSLVERTFQFIDQLQPKVWAIENPPGRLPKVVNRVGNSNVWRFHPHNFAAIANNPAEERYRKRTNIWGEYNIPELANLDPLDTGVKGQTWISLLPPSKDRPNIRSKTPTGFARAFYNANVDRALT